MVQSFGKHPIKLLITANSYCAKRSILNFARWELEQPGENPKANLIGEIAFLFTRLVWFFPKERCNYLTASVLHVYLTLTLFCNKVYKLKIKNSTNFIFHLKLKFNPLLSAYETTPSAPPSACSNKLNHISFNLLSKISANISSGKMIPILANKATSPSPSHVWS